MTSGDHPGIYTALVTPFRACGALDEDALRKHLQRQIAASVRGVVPCGTTGESPTLAFADVDRVLQICREETTGTPVKVVAGIGSNSTARTLELLNIAERARPDAVMVVVPYYSKPSQAGVIAHFDAIASATTLPIMAYNVPSRTVTSLEVDSLQAMVAQHPHIYAIKDAQSTNLERVTHIRQGCGKGFIQLSGDDASFAGYLGMGGHGLVSVSSNLLPRLAVAMHEAWMQGDWPVFETTRDLFVGLHTVVFSEPTPAVLKAGLAQLGIMTPSVRLPSVEATPSGEQRIASLLRDLAEWI
ncbi:MAG: 4-hydroxy-tetrahydrodipicolinate synthase [Alphaproteobacteria bacterium]|nr:4-hydroxy-tetrahydrodipicolinate synthase [Alphaproteobacteria bacterium]